MYLGALIRRDARRMMQVGCNEEGEEGAKSIN